MKILDDEILHLLIAKAEEYRQDLRENKPQHLIDRALVDFDEEHNDCTSIVITFKRERLSRKESLEDIFEWKTKITYYTI